MNRQHSTKRFARFSIAIACLAGMPLAADELVLVAEAKLADLLATDEELEASGVVVADGSAYVVFDNTMQVARIDIGSLVPGANHELLGRRRGSTGFEGIAYDQVGERFFAVWEAESRGNAFRGRLAALDPDFGRAQKEWLGYHFQSDNKGFEGLSHVTVAGDDYLLALCEGNDCDAGGPSRTTGAGRIKIFKEDDNGWDYEESVRLPGALAFEDYSGLDLSGSRLAVVSQSSSRLWIGELTTADWKIAGDWDVFTFPPTAAGERPYCNVEGVAWLPAEASNGDHDQLVVVSDSRKTGSGGQPSVCSLKEQSIHIFALPD